MSVLTLASSSKIRAALLRAAGLVIEVKPARIDEVAIRSSLESEGVSPRDIADILAEQKAQKLAHRLGSGLVLGCDQILALDGQCLGKPESIAVARQRLLDLRGRTHSLFSAAVLFHDGSPVWRHVSEARLTMRAFSDGFLESYLTEAGEVLCETAGAYAVEGLGIRLFERIEGDHFGILGLPLLELLAVLGRRGEIAA